MSDTRGRNGFRLLLAVVVYHYVMDAITRIPGGFFDWVHLVTALVTAPIVLIAAWRYSS